MTKSLSLTPERQKKLARAFDKKQVEKNPDLAMQLLTDWHDALGNSKVETEYKNFLEMLASPVVVNLLERNTGNKMSHMSNLVTWQKDGRQLNHINAIVKNYVQILRSNGSKEFYEGQDWRFEHMSEQNDVTLQNIDNGIVAHLANGTDDSYSEAFKLQLLQMQYSEDDEDMQKRVADNMTVVADACIVLATPKSYETAKTIFKHLKTISAPASIEREFAENRMTDLEKNPVENAINTIDAFLKNIAKEEKLTVKTVQPKKFQNV